MRLYSLKPPGGTLRIHFASCIFACWRFVLHEFEWNWYPRYDEVVYVAPRDAAEARLPATVSVSVVGNAVDVQEFHPATEKRSDRPVIVFHGNLRYLPNTECVRFLASVVGPQLAHEFRPDGFEIRLIGIADRALGRYVTRWPWMRMKGYVTNLADELNQATVYAAPLASRGDEEQDLGSTRLRTSGGGYCGGVPRHDCVLGRKWWSAAWKTLPGRLLRAAERHGRRVLGNAARAWAVRHASWDRVAQRFDALLQSSCPSRQGEPEGVIA